MVPIAIEFRGRLELEEDKARGFHAENGSYPLWV